MSGKVRALNQVLGPSGDDVNAPSFTWWSNSNTGIFQPGDNQIGLCTDGSEKVRLLNNGYVGIGTSSPDQMLHVASNAKIDGRMNVGEEGRLLLAASSSDNERGRISFNDDDENWKIYMARNAGVEGEFDSWAVRIRTSDNGGSGVVFENDSDQVTFSVRASDGNTYVRGDLNVDGDVNHEGDLNVEGNLNVEKDVFVAQGRHLNVWDSEGRRIEIGPGVNRSTGASIRTTDNVSTGETMFTVESSGGRNRFGVTHEYGTFARDALRVGYVFDDDSNLPSLSYTLDVNGDARVTSDIVTERDLEVLGTSTFRNDAYFHSGIDRIYSTNYKIYRIEDHPDAPSSPLISSRFSLGITGANGVGLFSGTDNNGWGECVMFADDDGVRMLGKLGVNHASPTYDIEVLKDGSEENAVIRCQADHYAGLILDGDIQDTSGEPGGAYVHFGVDARIRSLLSQVQLADERGDGESYSGTTENSMLLGTLQNYSLHFGTNESVRMTITGSGDVGIGTNSPSHKLDVSGNGRINGDLDVSSDLEVSGISTFRDDAHFHTGIDRIATTDYKIYRIEDHPDAPSSPLISSSSSLGISGASGVGLFSGTDNNGWGECVMFADDDGVRMLGKLGVNNASPTYDIEVLKDGSEENAVIRCQADHYAGLILDGDIQDTSGEPGGAYVHFGVDARIRSLLSQVQSPDQRGDGESYSGTTTNSMLLGTLQSNSLHFGTNESVRMTITGSGDVGIGTNSPSRKLDVSGNGRINGDLDVSSDLEVSGISTFGDDAHFHTGIDRIATNNYKIFRLRDHPDAPSSSLFSSSTSLGISGANGVGLFSGTENNGWGECAMFADGDGVRMLGKMGVNNASPDYTLDVGGSGRIDGDLHVDKGIHTLTGASPHGSNSVTTPGVRMMGVSAQDDETDMVWLMCRNRQGENEVMGDLMGSRSSSYFQFSKVSIYVSTAEDNSTKRGFIKTSQGLHDNERWKLITCEYDGDSYIALRYSGHDYPFSFLYFIGVVDTEGPEEAFKSLRTSDVSNISDFSNADTRETVQVEKMGINTDEPEHTLDVQGDIYASGEITSQSDARIKTDVTPIVDALAKVRALRGCVYSRADWETKGVAKDARYIGLIAQEVMPVVPEVVSVSESGTYSLNYMQLVALLVEGLKTLSDQNDGLAEDVRSLSTRLSRLEESRT